MTVDQTLSPRELSVTNSWVRPHYATYVTQTEL